MYAAVKARRFGRPARGPFPEATAPSCPAVADAMFKVNIEGLAGQLDWTSSKNPAPGVVDTPCVGVQWKPSSKWGYSMAVVDNTLMPNVPTTGTLEPTNK